MSDSGGIPELQYRQPDGRPRTRLEMDQWLRTEVPKVHWLRIHACRTLNLQKQISWGMQEIILRHWMLDELVRRQLITGDILGVNATSFNDEAELRQFAQRLAAMIQAGQAVQPQQAEGIEMQGYTPPPPPVMGAPHPQQPTAQPAAYPSGPPGPPPPPPGVPMGPPGYQAPAQQAQPQYAPPPPAPAPMGPPGGYQQPSGPPMGPPAMGPPGAPPAGPPPAAPVQAGPGRRGRRAEAAPAAPPPPASPVPPVSAPPQGFAPAGYAPPAAPAGFGPPPVQVAPQPMVQVPAPQPTVSAPVAQSVDLSPVLQKMDQLVGMVDQLRGENAAMAKEIKILSMTATVLVRGLYNKPATVDQTSAVELLKDLGYQIPQ